MKKIVYYLVVMIGFTACASNEKKAETSGPVLSPEEKQKAISDTSNYTTIQWLDSTTLALGKVKKGEVVEVSFRFKNTGDRQLVIKDVMPGCGCTSPEKPQQPFAPGEEGVIRARFDSKNQHLGSHNKPVTVEANTKPSTTHQLYFSVEITE